MSIARGAARVALATMMFVTACDGDEPDTTEVIEVRETAAISVTVPAERLTPFCQAMIELTDDLRNDAVDDAAARIIETYRGVSDAVPPEIAVDFAAVLAALEAGAPPPTDPPPTTTATTVPRPATDTVDATTTTASAGSGREPAGSGVPLTTDVDDAPVDEGFAPGNSPAERMNSYVSFACRDAQNNPGPPATQPLTEPVEDES